MRTFQLSRPFARRDLHGVLRGVDCSEWTEQPGKNLQFVKQQLLVWQGERGLTDGWNAGADAAISGTAWLS